jgi:tricarballylate dehydrogenase
VFELDPVLIWRTRGRAASRRSSGPPGTNRRQPSAHQGLDMNGREWDVVVVGGGNAALVSALTARDHGARVLVIECAEPVFRGGNSRHTRNIRCVHDALSSWHTGAYSHDELWSDLCGTGNGPSDEKLAALTVAESESVPGWMLEHGALFQPALRGTLHLGRTNTFFLGGGKALLNSYYRQADALGIDVLYEYRVVEMIFDGDTCTELVVVDSVGARHRVRGRAFVCASGGFEANFDWLVRNWGIGARNYVIRGPRYNDGAVLRQLLDAGASTAGEAQGFHSVAVDARSPKYDGGIATRVDSIPFGVVLNSQCKRFYDEGEDLWPKRYAVWGGKIAEQPGQIAYCFWDVKAQGRFLPPMYGVFRGTSISELASQMGIDGPAAERTVAEYNNAAPADGARRFDASRLDGVGTAGLAVQKSNWAQRLDSPPYYGIAVLPGVTFTYMGVKIDKHARVQLTDDAKFRNVFAAGEIMSGNILSTGYMAGFGMTIGTVWGRIAGREAALYAVR